MFWQRRLTSRAWLAALLLALILMPAAGLASEATVCGALRERLAFWSWSRLAGSADPARAMRVEGAEAVARETRDGRTLRGWRLVSRATDGVTRRVVLVAGGNAMLADQILDELAVLAEAGLEVHVFDYRGYGASEGRPRLEAIIGDLAEIAASLAAESTAPLAFHGISMGGVVLANALARLDPDARPERFVIDGSPARVSPHGCPPAYDTVENLPADRGGMLFVGGEQDTVIPLRDSQELIEAILTGGGNAVVRPDFAHPFMDAAAATRRERLTLIAAFLAG